MSKILVTGGAGFIGSHTVVELAGRGFTPVILDDFSNTDERIMKGLEKILKTAPQLYRTNCTNKKELQSIFEQEQPAAVIHFAAFKAVGESVEQPLKYYHNNLVSLIVLLEVMEQYGVRNLVFSSSCTIYGQPTSLPVSEQTPEQEATSPYGYTKQVCERMLRDYSLANPSFNCALLRYFNPIGAHRSGMIGELPFGIPNNLVPYITQTAAGIREKLTVHGNDYATPDGSCIRDFIHVTDLAEAHVESLKWLETKQGVCEAFNLGQGEGNTVLEVIKTFEQVNKLKLNYEIGPRRSGDVEKIFADTSKAADILGWRTRMSLEDALADAWRWQKNLPNL